MSNHSILVICISASSAKLTVSIGAAIRVLVGYHVDDEMFSKSELLLPRSTAVDNEIQAKYWLLVDEMPSSSSNCILLFLSVFIQ